MMKKILLTAVAAILVGLVAVFVFADPPECKVGDVYLETSRPPRLYYCEFSETWERLVDRK